MDRVTRVIDRNGKATVYEYDALGNRSVVRYPNGNEVTYTYDACQRLKEEWITNANGITLAKYTYGLGKAGERTSITEINSSGTETETTYKYDKLNRLVKETIERDKNKLTNEYTYDKVSNRISKETTVKGELSVLADAASEEIKVTEGKTTYTYNALNQLVTETSPDGAIVYTYDNNGNLIKQTGDKTADYSYDKENHLLRATIQKGNSVTIESYTYDYAGNRTSKTVNEQEITYYVNDTSLSLTQVVAETDKDGKEKSYYTRSDELVSMEKGNEIWYYLYDGHGSVRILTNEAGRVTDRYSYDAYGILLEKEGDTENEFLYTGEQYNANTGLYYLRARYMNPSTGTFISMDSYQGSIYDPISLHKYLYAGANPVMYTDPSGYMSMPELVGCTSISEVLQTSFAFNILNAVRGALVGAVIGAVESILGGNSFSKVWKDALVGAGFGLLVGFGVSAVACLAVIYPKALMALSFFKGISLVLGGIGVYISCEEENYMQAVFRGILALFAYKGMGKIIDDVNLYRLNNTGNYLAGKAPKQVSPGTRYLEGQYINDQGKVQPWKAYYDEYGRLIARTDYNAGNRAQGIPEIHYHLYECGPGKNPAQSPEHFEGEYIP